MYCRRDNFYDGDNEKRGTFYGDGGVEAIVATGKFNFVEADL